MPDLPLIPCPKKFCALLTTSGKTPNPRISRREWTFHLWTVFSHRWPNTLPIFKAHTPLKIKLSQRVIYRLYIRRVCNLWGCLQRAEELLLSLTLAHHSPPWWEMVKESHGNDGNNASESLDPNCAVHVTHLGSAIAALRRPMINWPWWKDLPLTTRPSSDVG